jgi:acyl-CoA synthetase (AMP-forming)/AMP-acid ligase II
MTNSTSETSPLSSRSSVASLYMRADTAPRETGAAPDPLLYVTFPQMIANQARFFGDRDLVVDVNDRITYAAFETQMTQVARAAMSLGVTSGDRVAIWAPNSLRWLVAAMGASAAGATMMPMNSRFKGTEAAEVIQRVRPRILFTVRDFLGSDYPAMLRACADPADLKDTQIVVLDADGEGEDMSWHEFLSQGENVTVQAAIERRDSASPDDVSDIILTSGTTGRPKGVLTSHYQNMLGWMRYARHLELQTGERISATLPFFHNFGLKAGFLVSAMLGGTCICEDMFDPSRLANRIADEKITYLKGTPALFTGLLASADRTSADLSSLRLCLVAGSTIPRELVQRMQRELCPNVVAGYGLSELGGGIALTPIGVEADRVADWAGALVEGVEVRVVDVSGKDLPFGQTGEFLARSESVMIGYLDDTDATHEAIDESGWLHTGDVGILSEEGYLQVTDRRKDMFIVGGFNADPAEIERLLLGHPAIAPVAVVGMPDDRLGEVPAAFVVPKPGTDPDGAEIIAWARANISNYKVPRRVELIQHLPVNASMKVLKHELKAQLAVLLAANDALFSSNSTAN